MISEAKRCRLCREFKPLDAFYTRKDGRQAGNRSSACKPCTIRAAKEGDAINIEGPVIRSAKHRAKNKGLPFDLDGYRQPIFERMIAGCELTGVRFALGAAKNDGRQWNSPSIDRIDPVKGYTYSNIRIICWALNSAFGNWGEDQFETVVQAWLEQKYKGL